MPECFVVFVALVNVGWWAKPSLIVVACVTLVVCHGG